MHEFINFNSWLQRHSFKLIKKAQIDISPSEL